MRSPRVFAGQFVALLGFWLLLSWRLDPLFWVMGVVFAALLTVTTQRMTTTVIHAERPSPQLRRVPLTVARFFAYAVWLLTKIVVAGAQIAWLVVMPGQRLDPVMLRLTLDLQSPLARAALTNSITLVPGTLTVELDDDHLTVHALFPAASDDLISGDLQNRIARLFLEGPQPRPHVRWHYEAPETGHVASAVAVEARASGESPEAHGVPDPDGVDGPAGEDARGPRSEGSAERDASGEETR